MAAKKSSHISKFLKKANKAIDDAVEQGIKKADVILDDAVKLGKIASSEAQKKSADLRKITEKKAAVLKKRGEKKITEGISLAKEVRASRKDDLETLEKLAKLRKSGVITAKEFQAKKKKILGRI